MASARGPIIGSFVWTEDENPVPRKLRSEGRYVDEDNLRERATVTADAQRNCPDESNMVLQWSEASETPVQLRLGDVKELS